MEITQAEADKTKPLRTVPVYEPLVEEAYNYNSKAIVDWVYSQPDPSAAEARIRAAQMLSERTDMDIQYAFENFDAIAEAWTGAKGNNVKAWESIKKSYEIADKGFALNKLYYDQMMGNDSEELAARIAELESSIPVDDEVKKFAPLGWVKSAANMLPSFLNPTLAGIQEGTTIGTVGDVVRKSTAAIETGTPEAAARAGLSLATMILPKFARYYVGGRLGSFDEMRYAESGALYRTLTKEMGVDNDLATTLSLASGYAIAGLESLQFEKLPGINIMTSKAAGKAAARVAARAASEGLEGAAKRSFARAAGTLGKNIVTNALEETSVEVLQEFVTIGAEELAKELKDNGVAHANATDIAYRVFDTAAESFKAFTVMGLPGNAASFTNNVLKYQQAQRIEDKFKSLSPEDAAAIETVIEEEVARDRNVSIVEGGKISGENGDTAGRINYSIDDNKLNIQNIELQEGYNFPEVAAQVVEKIIQDNPGIEIDYSELKETSGTARRAVEDQYPTLQRYNRQLDIVRRTVEKLQAEQETLKQQIDKEFGSPDKMDSQIESWTKEAAQLTQQYQNEESEEAATEIGARLNAVEQKLAAAEELEISFRGTEEDLELSYKKLERAEEAKKAFNPLEEKPAYKMHPDEYAQQNQARSTKRFSGSAEGETLKLKLLDAFPRFTQEDADAAIALIDARAAAEGMTTDEYVSKTFSPEVFRKGIGEQNIEYAQLKGTTPKAAVSFLEDGRAIIRTTEISDFSSFVHELGHIIRKQLNDAEMKIVETEYGVKNHNWTKEAEERFAIEFEAYIEKGQIPHNKLKAAFQKMAEIMASIYRGLRAQLQLSPEIIRVMDGLFDEDRMKMLSIAKNEEELILFQSAAGFTETELQDMKKTADVLEKQNTANLEAGGRSDNELLDTIMRSAVRRQGKLYELSNALSSGVQKFTDENRQRIALVHKSSRPEAKYQVSYFDRIGAYSHTSANSAKDVFIDLQSSQTIYPQAEKMQLGNILFQTAPPTNSEAFREWFGNSQVVDDDGKPLGVYHATNAKFGAFRIENDGRPNDAVAFFTGDRRYSEYIAKQIQGMTDTGEWFPPTAIEKAKDFITGRSPRIISAYLKIENPVYIGRVEDELSIENLWERLKLNKETIPARLKGRIDNVYRFYVEDEAIWQELKAAGYDGAIGTERGAPLYVVFSPNQIKSVKNQGTWNPDDPRILFQDDHRNEVKKAVEEGVYVPDEVLYDYAEDDWATEELQRRNQKDEQMLDLTWLQDEARKYNKPDEFISYIDVIYPEKGKDPEWLRDFWYKSQPADIEINNKRFREQWGNEDGAKAIIKEMQGWKAAKENATYLGFSGTFIAAMHANREPQGKELQKMVAALKNPANTETYREAVALLFKDRSTHELLQRDIEAKSLQEKEPPADIPKEKTLLDVAGQFTAKLRNRILSGKVTQQELDAQFAEDRKVMNESWKRLVELEQQQKELNNKYEKLRGQANKVTETQKKEIISLKKQISSLEKKIAREKRYRAERKAAAAERKKAKDYMLKLGKAITRKVPSTVYFKQREEIQAIQSFIDPKFRLQRTIDERKAVLEEIEKNPTFIMSVGDNFLKEIHKKSLNEFSIDDLENIHNAVELLTIEGKAEFQKRKKEADREVKRIVAESINIMLNGKEFSINWDPVLEDKATAKDKAQSVFLSTMRPSRIADMIDGGAGFKGPIHSLYIDEVNNAYADEIRYRQEREERMRRAMKQYSLKETDFARTFSGYGLDATLDQVLKMYANTLNDRNHDAQRWGHHIGDWHVRSFMNKALKEFPQARNFADALLADYDENFDRLDDAHLLMTNQRLPKEINYSPLNRKDDGYSWHAEKLADEISQEYGIARGRIAKSFTKSRVNIAPQHQRKMDFQGLYSEWLGQVEKQEHYIAMSVPVRKMRRVLDDSKFRQVIKDKKGRAFLSELDHYISRVANPGVMWSHDQMSRILRLAKKNYAIYALSGNLMTALKQVPSLMYYLPETDPGNLLAALGQTAAKWEETRAFVEELDPGMKDRSVERDIAALKKAKDKGVQDIINKVGEAGMKPILMMDKIAVTAGWMAVYQNRIDKGYSDLEAVQEARNVTQRTQPASRPHEIASLYTKESWSVFTMFSNQLNQIWNISMYDAPAAILSGHAPKGFAYYGSMALANAFIWCITKRKLPEEPKEYLAAFATGFINMIPLVGSQITQMASGWRNADIFIFEPLKDIMTGVDYASEGKASKAIEKWLDAAAKIFGAPGVEAKRIKKGLKQDSAGKAVQYIILGGEWNVSK